MRRNRERGITPDFSSGVPRWKRDSDVPWAIEAAAREALDGWDEREADEPSVREPSVHEPSVHESSVHERSIRGSSVNEPSVNEPGEEAA